jgi:hypothetical protein
VKPTRFSALVGTAVICAVLSFAGVRLWDSYGALPEVPSSAPLTLFALAVVVAAAAVSLRGRLRAQRERRPGAKAVDPLVAARAVVLAKASSLVGSLFVGVYAGYALYLAGDLEVGPRRSRALVCLACVLAGLLLVAAALFLERVCRIPPSELEEDNPDEEADA